MKTLNEMARVLAEMRTQRAQILADMEDAKTKLPDPEAVRYLKDCEVAIRRADKTMATAERQLRLSRVWRPS
jgi:hypothetical protein